MRPSRQDLRDVRGPIVRGSAIGVLLGVLRGMASAVSTFSSYLLERRISKQPEKFGAKAPFKASPRPRPPITLSRTPASYRC